jgi:hypothetical protein
VSQLISNEYKEQNRKLHDVYPEYGTTGAMWRDVVREESNWGRMGILDYGCGKQTLSKSLGPAYRVTDFDPCIPGLDTPPAPHSFVVCGDVLEHIEPELLDNVLADLRRLCLVRGFFVVHIGPAMKILDDGRNAHLIQKPRAWWSMKLEDHGFKIVKQGGGKNDAGAELAAWFVVE